MSKTLCAASLALMLAAGTPAFAQSSSTPAPQPGPNATGNAGAQGATGSRRADPTTPATAPGAGKVDHQTGGQSPDVQPKQPNR